MDNKIQSCFKHTRRRSEETAEVWKPKVVFFLLFSIAHENVYFVQRATFSRSSVI